MRFVAQRLALFAVTLFGMSVLIFLALRILPGDVATVMAGIKATPQQVARLRENLGLNRSLPMQYLDWASDLLHGDLGTSILTGRDVGSQVLHRLQITLPLISLALLLALIVGLSLGTAYVVVGNDVVRQILHVAAIAFGAVPALWAGLLLVLLFARGSGLIGLFPSQGFPQDGWADPGAALLSLALPSVTLGVIVGAGIMRYTSSALNEIVSSGYVEMAMACGMTRTQALLRVGLRIVSPQLVSVTGLTFAEMITGAMVIENLFALSGVGSMIVTDVGNRDLITVQSELFLLCAFFLLIGLVVDLLHRALDPRLRNASVLEAGGAES